MSEQLTLWSVIMMNGFFILISIGHIVRTILLKTSILEKNIVMYVAFMIGAIFFNFVCLDKIGKETAQILLSSIAGVIFGAVGNMVANEWRKKIDSDKNK